MENILPFWMNKVIDRENGGFTAEMANDLIVNLDAPKGLILNARLLWTYAAVYRSTQDQSCRELAQRAYDYLDCFFWDREYGGAFWRVDRLGNCLDGKKKIYGQAFYLYALIEYYLAVERLPALDRAIRLFKQIEQNSHDEEWSGYFETFDRDWALVNDCRLSVKDMNEKKSMNNHLHLLEAYTHLYRVWKDNTLANRLEELIQLFKRRILDPETFHFHHFFDERWNVKSATYTFGHDIEGSWLLHEAAEVLEKEPLLSEIRNLVLQIARVTCEQGLDTDGGLFYEGQNGAVIDFNKEWWPQAEAVVGFLNAYELCGKESFFDAALGVWTFIEQRMIDKHYGEWFWRVSRDGRVDPNEPKVSEWKGPYHNTRACLETTRRLRRIDWKEE